MQSSALWLPFDFVGCVHSPTISLDVFAWWHLDSPSTSPVACIHFQCLRHAAAQLYFVSFIFDNLRHSSYPSHSVSLLRSNLPSTCSPSFRIFGTSISMDFLRKQCRHLCISSPSISSAACTHLRYLWSPLLLRVRFVAHHCFSAPSTFFRNQAVRTLSLGLRPLWLRALAFDVFGVVSLLFSIRIPRSSSEFTFAFYRIF
jgi:hypothetical protein